MSGTTVTFRGNLGGALGTVAILIKQEILLLIVGGVFVMEAVSVILQVGYFKATGGKRLFKMAPIHHHFEQIGWTEPQIVIRFWIIAIVLALATTGTARWSQFPAVPTMQEAGVPGYDVTIWYAICGPNHRPDLQPERLREIEIALVVRRNRHDCSRAVVHQDEIPYPDGHLLAAERIDLVEARASSQRARDQR